MARQRRRAEVPSAQSPRPPEPPSPAGAAADDLLSPRLTREAAREAFKRRSEVIETEPGAIYAAPSSPARELAHCKAVRDLALLRVEEAALNGDPEKTFALWSAVYERLSERVRALHEDALASVPLTINGFDCRDLVFHHADGTAVDQTGAGR